IDSRRESAVIAEVEVVRCAYGERPLRGTRRVTGITVRELDALPGKTRIGEFMMNIAEGTIDHEIVDRVSLRLDLHTPIFGLAGIDLVKPRGAGSVRQIAAEHLLIRINREEHVGVQAQTVFEPLTLEAAFIVLKVFRQELIELQTVCGTRTETAAAETGRVENKQEQIVIVQI